MNKINIKTNVSAIAVAVSLVSISAAQANVADSVVEKQRANLEKNTKGQGFGPQSPRDIEQGYGVNERVWGFAPNRSKMNLCNIHFHKNAEHKGGEFTTYAGHGDGKGSDTGFVYNGQLTKAQLKPVKSKMCAAKDQPLQSGDTLEVHYVFSAAQVEPGATLGACLDDNTINPGLRVEGQVIVLANDENALDFVELATVERIGPYFQAPNIPSNTGKPIEYLGSTTGPAYNENGSPIQVSWSVRPEVAIVDINSVGKWCEDNEFKEDYSHGVRNLVTNPLLLSPM